MHTYRVADWMSTPPIIVAPTLTLTHSDSGEAAWVICKVWTSCTMRAAISCASFALRSRSALPESLLRQNVLLVFGQLNFAHSC